MRQTLTRRLEAFLSPEAPEVFHPIEHRHEIWRFDPFDVETVHSEARDVFARVLTRATTPPGPIPGRVLLLLGDSGSGKTHLVRAFRNYAHGDGLGFVGYMAMTSDVRDYGNYVLANLIESFDWPYYSLKDETTGLMRLSRALSSAMALGERQQLAGDELSQEAIDDVVFRAADELRRRSGYETLDLGLVRALLYLQRDDPRVKACVLSYLRCEDLPLADRRIIGGLAPRTTEDAPRNLVKEIGRLIWRVAQQSLIVCVDQLEDMLTLDAPDERFRRALATVCALADSTPSSLFVICCLRDYYYAKRAVLTRSIVDRLELDPAPVLLASGHPMHEVRLLVARRLSHLYSEMDVATEETTDPIPDAFIDRLARMRTRDVIEHCRQYRERAVMTGLLPDAAVDLTAPLPPPVGAMPATGASVPDLEQRWNDHRATFKGRQPEDEAGLAQLMAWAVNAASEELETGHRFRARARDGFVDVDVLSGEELAEHLLIAVCERSSKGGGLGRQIEDAVREASGRTLVILRSTEYPSDPRSVVAKRLGEVVRAGGRRVVLEDSDCRTILALQAFRGAMAGEPSLARWLATENPVSRTPALRALLGLDALKPKRARTVPPEARPATVPQVAEAARPAPKGILVGRREGVDPGPFVLDPDLLRRHAAFLGGAGSGKTTLALNLIEQLLLGGVPVLAIDRKGDLASYADPEAWTRSLDDPALVERRRRLRSVVDVGLYTPGKPDGRPLAISLLADGTADLSELDKEDEVSHAAAALAAWLGYRDSARDRAAKAILVAALRLLARLDAPVTLDRLAGFIDDEDPALVAAIGRLDTKQFRRVVTDVETLKLTAPRLFVGEPLDFSAMFSRRARIPLSIVSTKFLGDTDAVLYWMAQFLVRLGRWASRHPSNALQAVLLLEEADLYLPAERRPPTKAPLEGLLKRARAAGVGVLLATQSPGDLDYRCRDNVQTWFIGRVKEPVAQAKMKPMLSEARVDVSAKLAARQPGQFFLLEPGAVTPVVGQPSAIAPEQMSEDTIVALAAKGRPG